MSTVVRSRPYATTASDPTVGKSVMSFTLHGVGVSGGIAIGYAQLISHATLEVPHYVLPKQHIAGELQRFDEAIEATRTELGALREHTTENAPSEIGAFLDMHLLILEDEMLSQAPKQLIESQQCNAEWALKQQMEALIDQFERIEDAYLRERKSDVEQVAERILKSLLGHPSQAPLASSAEESSILVAHDLSPADVILFKRHHFAAFITDVGGITSHTAIVARSLNIPCIVALHHAREVIRERDLLIIDGTQGVVIVNPDQQILTEYKLRREELDLERQKLRRLRKTRAVTLDGVEIKLEANIELPQDVEQAKANGATGVGLFRSEFLFLNRDSLPDEEEQYHAYLSVAEAMGEHHVTVRTLDLGADKSFPGFEHASANPALGLRAIRLCLAEPQVFHTQLRAILRASRRGNIRILIPMLCSIGELQQALYLIEQAKRSLREQNEPFDDKIAIGGMIEIPAAALMVSAFAAQLDFLSIGTNDLIQYTLAIDRTDDTVAHLYDPLHPAVLRLIAHSLREADKAKTTIAVCGEMAGDPKLTRLLIGFGLRDFSMHPAQLLPVKQQILQIKHADMRAIAIRVLRTNDPSRLRALVDKLNA